MKKFIFSVVIVLMSFTSYAADQIVVYAASSVTDMMDEIIGAYNKANGTSIVASYAASGTLARQIIAGAPASIFISADPIWVDELEKNNLTDVQSRKDYLGNKLVLIANSKSSLTYDFGGGVSLSSILKSGERFAIGDPDYVPAGKYAQEALTFLNQWNALRPSMVFADNVRVVLMFVERNEAVLGAVYGSDAAASANVKVLAGFPDSSYTAIRYPIVMIKENKTPEVEKFYNYLISPAVSDIVKKHGFSPL